MQALRYVHFCVFVKSTDFRICYIIIGIAMQWSCTYAYFFWILSNIKMKFGQIVVLVLYDKLFKHAFGSMLETGN